MQPHSELLALHTAIVHLLEEYGGVFNSPEHTRDRFIAHSTIQREGRLQKGDEVTVNSVALVDMFPNGNGEKRKIIDIYPLAS
jgi:hypothetical protein